MPDPYYHKIFPGNTHYPNNIYCGFCVYDMDSNFYSMHQEEFYDDFDDFG